VSVVQCHTLTYQVPVPRLMGRLKCDAAWLFKYIYETKITKK
jgi:hypothetical protein